MYCSSSIMTTTTTASYCNLRGPIGLDDKTTPDPEKPNAHVFSAALSKCRPFTIDVLADSQQSALKKTFGLPFIIGLVQALPKTLKRTTFTFC